MLFAWKAAMGHRASVPGPMELLRFRAPKPLRRGRLAVGSLEVKTGRHLLLDRSKEDPSLTFAELLRRGHDSVLMDRGVCMKGPHKGKKAGNEWIVYSWDQVQVLKEVPRDPVP